MVMNEHRTHETRRMRTAGSVAFLYVVSITSLVTHPPNAFAAAGPGTFDDLASWVPDDLSNDPTSLSFGTTSVPAIPSNYFYNGSDAFSGQVFFRGSPIDIVTLGDTSTVMQRPVGDPVQPFDPPGAMGTVPIEIVALSLVSVEPIVVTGTDAPQIWNVRITLSPTVIPPPGQMTAIKHHPNGGVFTSTINVQPLFTFTRVSDAAELTLDTGLEGQPHVALTAFDVPFVHLINPALEVVVSEGAQFIPGVNELKPGNIHSQEIVPFAVATGKSPGPEGFPDIIHTICLPIPNPKVCIYSVTCASEDCETCPLGCNDLCQSAACTAGSCTTGFSTLCGGPNCCLILELVECRLPDGEPACPTNDPCACIDETGACCLPDKVCLDELTKCECEEMGGAYMGDGTECGPVGACCVDPETCEEMAQICCEELLGGDFQGGNCDPPGEMGVCCLFNGNCFEAIEQCCDGIFVPNGSCTPSTGCCLSSSNTCINISPNCCAALDGSTMNQPCGEPEACCTNSGCIETDPACCTSPSVPIGGSCSAELGCCVPANEFSAASCVDEEPTCCFVFRGGTPLPNPCGESMACCTVTGLGSSAFCNQLDADCCSLFGGTVTGSACNPNLGCCGPVLHSGTCVNIPSNCCPLLPGTTLPTLCLPPEACCFAPGNSCINNDSRCCEITSGFTPAGPNVCSASQACCRPDGTCHGTPPECCIEVFGDTPVPGPCAPTSMCCLPDATCIDTNPECCLLVDGIPLEVGPLCVDTGACCLSNGTCGETTVECCGAQDGVFMGILLMCGGDGNGNGQDDLCEGQPPPVNCCLPLGSCIVTTSSNCATVGGTEVVACLGDGNGNGIDDACDPCCDGTGQGDVSKTYCIIGSSDAVGYSWELSGPTYDLVELNADAVPKGGDATDLAAAFVESLNTIGCPDHAVIDKDAPNCFTVTICGDDALTLSVGADGQSPDCDVTSDGCEYNPTITEQTSGIPTLSQWGVVVTAILMVIAGTIVLGRRRAAAM